jgi:hypothetical protein
MVCDLCNMIFLQIFTRRNLVFAIGVCNWKLIACDKMQLDFALVATDKLQQTCSTHDNLYLTCICIIIIHFTHSYSTQRIACATMCNYMSMHNGDLFNLFNLSNIIWIWFWHVHQNNGDMWHPNLNLIS